MVEVSQLLDRPVAFHPILAQITGDVLAGLMLSQALYWSKRTKDPNGWFYKTQKEWTEETCMTRSNLDTARKVLRKFSFWEEKLRGVPATLHYRIDHAILSKTMTDFANQIAETPQTEELPQIAGIQQTRLQESSNTVCGNDAIYYRDYTETTQRLHLVNLPKAENLLVASSEIPSQEIVEPSLANSPNVDSQETPAADLRTKRARRPQAGLREGKTSGLAPKMEPSPVSASPSAHQVMMAALATTTNQPIMNGAAQGKAIKTILSHYSADQGIEVLHWMADPKTNWRGKVDWLAVQSFIPEYFRRKTQQQQPPQEPKPNGISTTKRDFSRIIANLPEHLR